METNCRELFEESNVPFSGGSNFAWITEKPQDGEEEGVQASQEEQAV